MNMEKREKEKNYRKMSLEELAENFDIDDCFFDYGKFRLETLVDKIKSKTYRPRPKMLYL